MQHDVYKIKELPVLPAGGLWGNQEPRFQGGEMLGGFLAILQPSPGGPGRADPGGGLGRHRTQVFKSTESQILPVTDISLHIALYGL